METYIKAVASSGGTNLSTAKLMKTGQTISYLTGDDGDLQEGRNVDFFTLAENNPFGNTNRFTDELGTQTYTNDIVIDWSTYNGSTVLGWYRVIQGWVSWNSAIANSLLFSIGTFVSGWRVPNANEFMSIHNFSAITRPFNYAPFNNNNAFLYWTSTTVPSSTTDAITVSNTFANIYASRIKTSTSTSYRTMICRTFTVTGTTLS